MEQLNIAGKRSGSNGFVAHKATLVNALSRTLSERVILLDFTIGRKGFLGYLKTLGGNVVKVTPYIGASDSQANGNRSLKVACGSFTSFIEDLAFCDDNTAMTYAEVRVSPKRTVKPNIGSMELAEALDRVLPFTDSEDTRPVLQCVLFTAVDGKLSLASADGFRLAVVTLDCDIEGKALIHRDDLNGIASALRKARRVAVGFEKSSDNLDGMNLIIDTELIRYRWIGFNGEFPDYEKLIPTELNTTVSLDTIETMRAVNSLGALATDRDFPVDIGLTDGGMVLSNPDNTGTVTIDTDVQGNDNTIRVQGKYLSQALRACGGMADLSLTGVDKPLLFTVDGYQLVVMPMVRPKQETPEPDGTPEAVEQGTENIEAETKPEKPKAESDGKAKRSRKKEKVAV